MAMIDTSDCTAPRAISNAAKIGRSSQTTRAASGGAVRARKPNTRPNTTKINTGTPTAPSTPSGSRTKILISSHVSLQSPRSMVSAVSIANRAARQLEKHVLEGRQLGEEVGHHDPMRRQAVDHVRHRSSPRPRIVTCTPSLLTDCTCGIA